MKKWHRIASLAVSVAALIAANAARVARGEDDLGGIKAQLAELEKQNAAMRSRLTELEKKEDDDWLTTKRTNQIQQIVQGVLDDAKVRGDFSGGTVGLGYDNGFYIQSPDDNFKLSIGGILQVRYELAMHHADNASFKNPPLAQGDNENASGFDIRRARINFSGHAFSPDLFYRLEGDFYGSAAGGFTVTDAYIGYEFNDLFKIRAGAFKTPFTKAELEYEADLEMERAEVNFPFDPQRSLGFSLFGDLIKDRLGYEINANDGARTNTLHYVDSYINVATVSGESAPGYNVDNRMAYYGRLQWAGAGAISEFYRGGEADLREDSSPFIWMLGAAGGYESQSSGAVAYPQNTLAVAGLGSNDSPGFIKAYALNGDIYRGTVDWSAKWRGLSFNTAFYFQQVNANPIGGSAAGGLPYHGKKSSFFQDGFYAQLGYMVIPRRLELLGAAGFLFDEGDPNIAEFYTVGASYYLYGKNAKILLELNYSPEAAYTDASTLQIANTRELLLRLQLQLKF